MGKFEEQLLRGEDPFGFTDEQARKLIEQNNKRVMAVDTQHGIIKYMEAMAQVVAEAAIASQKALGDSPLYAVDKWINVVKKRAKELVREKQDTTKQLEKGTVIDQEK